MLFFRYHYEQKPWVMLDRSEKSINVLLVIYCVVLAVFVLASTVAYNQLVNKQGEKERAQPSPIGAYP
jgi:flagellar basal body-associated protein FliL